MCRVWSDNRTESLQRIFSKNIFTILIQLYDFTNLYNNITTKF